MSLRSRWAITLALVAAVAVGASVATSLVFTGRQLIREVDGDLTRRVGFFPPDFRELFARPFGPGARGRGLVESDALVQLVLADGRVVRPSDQETLPVDAADTTLASATGEDVIRNVDVAGMRYRMITTHIGRGDVSGALQIAVGIEQIDRALAALRRRLLLLWVAACAVAGAVGWLLARRALGPIEKLTATAEHVAVTEQLDVPLDTTAPAEVGRLATAFASMLASLQSSRTQQAQLASDAGHELRTPLTALRTNLETLKRRGAELTEDQQTELLDAAITEAGELSTLSAELVDLASDARRDTETPVNMAFDELVARVVDRFRRRTEHDIELRGTGGPVKVRASQVERALSNLIDNALKWAPGNTPIEVVIDGTSVHVRDHGPGIPREDLPHVFERFYRSVSARSMPGSGLGLAIVEHIVSGHGGTVSAANATDGGAVVGFTLPEN